MIELIEQIKRVYTEERANPQIPSRADTLPLSFEDISCAWLTDALCRAVPGAEVIGITLGAPDSGSSNRRKIRIDYNEIGTRAGLPRKVFCKASHDLVNRVLLACSGALDAEVSFYKKFSKLVAIEVPVCRYAHYDNNSYNSLIILDDLSDTVESFCSHETYINLAKARSQMALLAAFHARFNADVPGAEAVLADLATWPEFFGKTLATGMKEGSNAGFLAAQDVIPPALYARYEEIWPATLRAVDEHNHLPNTLTHNDVHLKNWYVMPGDRMGLSDWQCCGRGHWGRDLAYTLATALTVEDRRLWERELVAYYVEKLQEGGVQGVDFDSAWLHYRKQLLSALTWWTITLRPAEGMPDMQPVDITLEFIRRISTAMDDVGTMDLFI